MKKLLFAFALVLIAVSMLSAQEMVTVMHGVVPAQPIASPSAPYSGGTTNVTLSTTSGTIYYSTSGTAACGSSTLWNGTPISVSSTTTIDAVSCKSGFSDSSHFNGTYVITGATFTKRQNTFSGSSCTPTSTTCNVTVTATIAHSAGILFYEQQYTNAGTLTAVSGGGGTWVVDPGCAYDLAAATSYIVCAYNVDMASSTTTLTLTLSGAPGSGSGQNVAFFEYGYSGSSVSKDTVGIRQQLTQVSPLPGVTLTLSGTTDVIVQCTGYSSNTTGIQAPYGNYTGGGGSQLTCGDIENTSSGGASNFLVSAADYGNLSAIALKGN